MKDKSLHIISFDIPYPPVYGGIIDVFYKLKALSEAGIRISLHAFYKEAREVPPELTELCDAVNFYPRKMDKRKALGTTPFIIASRYNDELVRNLEKDDAPILLEGMHSASILSHPAFRRRHMVLRMHNIEWTYYRALAQQEKGLLKSWYFRIEAMRLQNHANVLKRASRLLTISEFEQNSLSGMYSNCSYLPPFHGNTSVQGGMGLGDFALYHGNLGVVENRKAVEFLIREVFLDDNVIPLKVAGSNVPTAWMKELKKFGEHFEFIADPDDETLTALIRNAQMNVLPTFQETGVKLKLINALYNGKHCIVNRPMVLESSLESICHVADDAREFRRLVEELTARNMTAEVIAERSDLLAREFDDQKNGAKLIEWLYPLR